MTALFRDQDTPTVVDSNEIGDEITGDCTQDRTILRAYDLNLVLGHKQRSTAKHRIQATRLI